MNSGIQERLEMVTELAVTAFHYGFVPLVLYLGFRKGAEAGMPPLSLMSLLWQ